MDNLTLAYVLIACGLVLMTAEIFLPTGGFLFFPAGILVVAGVVLSFVHGDPYLGMATLIGCFLVVPFIGFLAVKALPYSPFTPVLGAPKDDVTVADMPGVQGLDRFAGQVGKATSALRPSGVVDFDGRRIDCVSEGMMIEAGEWVRCVSVKSGKVVVRRIDTPNPKAFENTDFG